MTAGSTPGDAAPVFRRVRRIFAATLFVACWLFAPACRSGGPSARTEGPAFRWEVVVDGDARAASVTLSGEGVAADRLHADHKRAFASAKDLADVGPGRVRWRVDLASSASGGDFADPTLRGSDVVLSPDALLLRPKDAARDRDAELVWRSPPGSDVSAPFAETAPRSVLADGTTIRTFRVDPTAAAFASRIAVVSRPLERIMAAGTEITLAVVGGRRGVATPAGFVATAAEAAFSLTGPPREGRTQLVLIAGGRGSPFPFGMTFHGGGPGVVALYDERARPSAVARDWVLAHEFLHAAMPVFEPGADWISEGFVQYYTAVVRARAGLLTDSEAWDELFDGLERGAVAALQDGGDLAEASVRMALTGAYQRVYWGGAAIALLLDAELRRRSDGARSLDDAMRRLALHYGGRAVPLKVDDALRDLDRAFGTDFIADSVRTALARKGPIEIGPVLARFGVSRHAEGRIVFDDGATDAEVRRAVLRPRR